MAKSIHVKAKTPWKRVEIPRNTFQENVFDGLIDVQELTDYDFIKTDHSKKKTNKRKATNDVEVAISKRQKSENECGDNLRKKKPQSDDLDNNSDRVLDGSKLEDFSDMLSNSEAQVNLPSKKKLGKNKKEKTKVVQNNEKEISSSEKKKSNSRKKKNASSCDNNDESIKVVDSISNVNTDSEMHSEQDVHEESDMKCHKNVKTDKAAKRKKKKKKTSKKSDTPTQQTVTNAEETVVENSNLDMSKWSDLFVPGDLLKSLQEQGFQDPTTIQILTLPSAIRDRRDILAAAETGSGKTLAFGIPVVSKILAWREEENQRNLNKEDCSAEESESEDNEDISEDSQSKKERTSLQALILEPTRELAVQVHRHLSKLAKHTDIKFALVVGGMSVEKQRRLLKHRPEVIIATPGRLWQLIEEGDEHLRQVDLIHSLVVDEADRMVEKGHYEELTRLLQMINKSPRRNLKRQSFVMSATLTMELAIPRRLLNKMKEKDLEKDKLKSLTSKICVGTKPNVIDLTPKDKVAQSLTEMRINCSAKEKDFYLYYFLTQHPGRTLVFANSKDCLRRLVSVFTLLECSPYPLHADMQQRQRLKNLDRFSGNSHGLLLASDVAARGLDIPNVDYVIHYQVPQTKENYVHRSGRTARASNVGLSMMLVAPEDARNYRKIVHGVKNGEELPLFPVELDLLPAVKGRVELARTIDVAEHRSKKVRLHNDFFSKAAEEMDMILDEKVLVPETEDSASQAEEKNNIKQLKYQLSGMLRASLAPLRMTKYPTKSGQLLSMKSVNLLTG